MLQRLCETCQNKDEDWFDKNGHLVKIPFCAANRPQFPSAYQCQQYELKEQDE